MSIGQLRREMTEYEYLAWTRFFAVKAQTRELEHKAAAARARR
jgi:hypothetical protein